MNESERTIAHLDADMEQAHEDFENAVDAIHEAVHESEDSLTDLATGLGYVERGRATVNSDITGDLVGIGGGTVSVAIGCVGSPAGWPAAACAIGAGTLDPSPSSLKTHREEKRRYEAEKQDLEEERDRLLAEVEAAVLQAADIRDGIIPSLEASTSASEELLIVADDELARARDALHPYKVTHGPE